MHNRGLYGGSKKERDPNDVGMGSKMPAGRNKWRQKSRIRWLKEGERNTKFLHRTTIARKAHKKFLKIKDQDGIERESHKEIENTLVSHLHGIAQKPNKDRT
jgi:hypothetical protein